MNEDGELSDDECELLQIDELEHRVEGNDPTLTKIFVNFDSILDAERLGTYMGRNTHLKALEFQYSEHGELDTHPDQNQQS